MTEPDRINYEISVIEQLEAFRSQLRGIEAGKPHILWPDPAELRRTISELEAEVASFRKE